MKFFSERVVIILLSALVFGCSGSPNNQVNQNVLTASSFGSTAGNSQPQLPTPAKPSETILPNQISKLESSPNPLSAAPDNKLTNEKVERAVNSMLAEFRLGGSVRVKGIQELPQQNAASADLQFELFEYGMNNDGTIVKAKNFSPKPMPKDQSRYPTMEEMFPQRKAVYSNDGKGILTHYNDERWVLNEVRWDGASVTGNIEIHN